MRLNHNSGKRSYAQISTKIRTHLDKYLLLGPSRTHVVDDEGVVAIPSPVFVVVVLVFLLVIALSRSLLLSLLLLFVVDVVHVLQLQVREPCDCRVGRGCRVWS